jgi:hypothetical protein
MSIEAVLVIPAFLLFLALIAGIGRTAMVRADIHAGVVSGARLASLESDVRTAEQVGRLAIIEHFERANLNCVRLEIRLDTLALGLPAGQAGQVTATATCVVPLADLAVPGLPGQVTITESFSTPINTYSEH